MAGLPDGLWLTTNKRLLPSCTSGRTGVVMRVGARVRSATTRHEFDTPGPAVSYGCPTFFGRPSCPGERGTTLTERLASRPVELPSPCPRKSLIRRARYRCMVLTVAVKTGPFNFLLHEKHLGRSISQHGYVQPCRRSVMFGRMSWACDAASDLIEHPFNTAPCLPFHAITRLGRADRVPSLCWLQWALAGFPVNFPVGRDLGAAKCL